MQISYVICIIYIPTTHFMLITYPKKLEKGYKSVQVPA